MARIPLFPRRDARLERRDAGLEARRRRSAPRPPSPRRRAVGSRAPAPHNGRRACGVPHHVHGRRPVRSRGGRRTTQRGPPRRCVGSPSGIRDRRLRRPRTGPPHELREEWEGLDVERDAWLVEIDGRVAGVAHLLEQKGGRYFGDAYVHPELTGRGVGTRLLESLEERVRELRPEWPDGERIVLEAAHLVGDERAPGLFAGRGFEYARSFFRMVIDVTEPQPDPVWPDGVELRPLEPDRDGPMLYARGDRGILGRVGLRRARVRHVAQAGVRPERLRPWSRAGRLGGRRGRRVLAELREAKRRLGVRRDARRPAGLATTRSRPRAAPRVVPAVSRDRRDDGRPRCRRREPDRRDPALRARRACTSSGRRTSGRRSSVQPAELAVRAPTPRDAAGIAEVLNAHAAATGRPADETGERVERWFELEDLDPARDMFLAVEGGRIVGYADVSAPGAERDVVNVDLRVPPGARAHRRTPPRGSRAAGGRARRRRRAHPCARERR